MSYYLDTSVIVPLLARESTSAMVDRWLNRTGDAVTTSRWAVVELASAIGLKVRSGQLNAAQATKAFGLFSSDVLPALSLVEVQPSHMAAASTLLGRFDLGLRAGDALHLAIVLGMTSTIMVTFDRRLREASIAAGLEAIEPS